MNNMSFKGDVSDLPGADKPGNLAPNWAGVQRPAEQKPYYRVPISQHSHAFVSSEAQPEASVANPTPCMRQRLSFQEMVKEDCTKWFTRPQGGKACHPLPLGGSRPESHPLSEDYVPEATASVHAPAQQLGLLEVQSDTDDSSSKADEYDLPLELTKAPQMKLTSKALLAHACDDLDHMSSQSIPNAMINEHHIEDNLNAAVGLNNELLAEIERLQDDYDVARMLIDSRTKDKISAERHSKELANEAKKMIVMLEAAKERETVYEKALSGSQARERTLLAAVFEAHDDDDISRSVLSELQASLIHENLLSTRLKKALVEKQNRLVELSHATIDQADMQDRLVQAELAQQAASKQVKTLQEILDQQREAIKLLEKDVMEMENRDEGPSSALHTLKTHRICGMRWVLNKLTNERMNHQATKTQLQEARMQLQQIAPSCRLALPNPIASSNSLSLSLCPTALGDPPDTETSSSTSRSSTPPSDTGYALKARIDALKGQLERSFLERDKLHNELHRLESKLDGMEQDAHSLRCGNNELKEQLAAMSTEFGQSSTSLQSSWAAANTDAGSGTFAQGEGSTSSQLSWAAANTDVGSAMDALSELALVYATPSQHRLSKDSDVHIVPAELGLLHEVEEPDLAAPLMKLLAFVGARTSSLGYILTGDEAADEAGLQQELIDFTEGVNMIWERIEEAQELSVENQRLQAEVERFKAQTAEGDGDDLFPEGSEVPAGIERLTKQRNALAEEICKLRLQLCEEKWKRTRLVRMMGGHDAAILPIPVSPMPPTPQLPRRPTPFTHRSSLLSRMQI